MINSITKVLGGVLIIATLGSCAAKKELAATKLQMEDLQKQHAMTKEQLAEAESKIKSCENDKASTQTELKLRQEQITDLRGQITDLKGTLAAQMTQVGDLTVLTQTANENMQSTLDQLSQKEQYVQYLQQAKSKSDSLNLALAVNLKSVLSQGIADQDIEVSIDKTVVMINLSDKMLFRSGSTKVSNRAEEVIGKIAQIIKARPGLDVMVEGFTDDKPISRNCISDNWDLSVQRSASIVRMLQDKFAVDPSRLIAAGRGEHKPIASNDTEDGRSANRRTKITIMPDLGQFYDLLKPDVEN